MTRKLLIASIVVLSLCLILACIVVLTPFMPYARDVYRIIGIGPTSPSVASPITPGAATAIPLLPSTPLAAVSNDTADALASTFLPPSDLNQIFPRLKKNPALATLAPTAIPRARRVGDKDQFFVVENASTGKYRTVTASLQVITPHAYGWVEDSMNVDQAALAKSVEFFENNVIPTNHKFFGVEKTGIDGDVHINILSTKFGDAAGYFSREDFYPIAIFQYSNQRNIIYMNVEAVKPGSEQYNADLAHEFQHLIHAYEAPYATGWIDEGMGDLAIKVNGFPVGGVLNEFARNPNTQLNTWANAPQESLAHYAASYLFFDYAAGRFGSDFTRDVILATREGVFGVQQVLDKRANGMKFEDLFADWAVANYLNDPKVEGGQVLLQQ